MSNIEERIKKIIVTQLGVSDDEITDNTIFTDDLGADSLDQIELIMGIEEEFDIRISDHDASEITTLAKAVDHVNGGVCMKSPSVLELNQPVDHESIDYYGSYGKDYFLGHTLLIVFFIIMFILSIAVGGELIVGLFAFFAVVDTIDCGVRQMDQSWT